MAHVVAIDAPGLGERGYLVHDGRVAFVVDPLPDTGRVLAVAGGLGVTITDVLATHLHGELGDHGLALARRTGAAYRVHAAERVAFERVPVEPDQLIRVGEQMLVRVVATPGHTATHLAYVLVDDQRPAVFTGGSLLCGTVGRWDLPGARDVAALERQQLTSVRRLAAGLPDRTEVFPSHGPGSCCAATRPESATSLLGAERRTNPVLAGDGSAPLATLLARPIGAGPNVAPQPPVRVDAAGLHERLVAGEWVVDVRARAAFAAAHLAGTLSFDLDGDFAPLLAALMPTGTPLTLLAADLDRIDAAARALLRAGLCPPVAFAVGTPPAWTVRPGGLAEIGRAGFADLAAARRCRPVVVLDVRDRVDHDRARLDGVLHIPVTELLDRLGEVPHGEVWLHCADGHRAMVAASLLAALGGREPVVVDDAFEPGRLAAMAGLVVREDAAQ